MDMSFPKIIVTGMLKTHKSQLVINNINIWVLGADTENAGG